MCQMLLPYEHKIYCGIAPTLHYAHSALTIFQVTRTNCPVTLFLTGQDKNLILH